MEPNVSRLHGRALDSAHHVVRLERRAVEEPRHRYEGILHVGVDRLARATRA